MKFKILIASYISFLSLYSFSQDTSSVDKKNALAFNANYVSDFVDNIHGGIKTGTAYLGQVNIGLTLNTKESGLWNGGEFYIHIQNSHGATPSANLVGDSQVFTNIENGNYTYLYEFRYKHTFDNIWINLGIIDLNTEFIKTAEGSNFINSAFGVIPSVSGNIPLSIFPKNALGIMLNYSISENLSVQTSIIDGNPGSLNDDPHNLKHKISLSEGLYYSGEFIYSNQNSKYKLCGYYHSGDFVDLIDIEKTHSHNFGLYAIADQSIITFSETKKVNGFIQMGYAPMNRNLIDFYFGSGLNYYSPFNRKNDVAGIAVAHARLCKDYYRMYKQTLSKTETTIEMNYSIAINKYLTVQPNIQYIINPGMSNEMNNSLVSTLRLKLSF